MAYDGPPIAPGQTIAQIDPTGQMVMFLFRGELSADPEPQVLAMPATELLLLVCRAVLAQAEHARRKETGIVVSPPNGLPGPGGQRNRM